MVLGASALAEGSLAQGGSGVNWLPYHRFELNSPLKPAEALAAMSAHTEPERFFRVGWPNGANDKRFEGNVSADAFHVRRVIGYRNSFLPVVDGRVSAAGRGSRVTITMRPFVFVFVFAAIWTIACLFMLFSPAWWFGPLMFAFLYLMTMGGFWWEASRQVQTLREIFQAT